MKWISITTPMPVLAAITLLTLGADAWAQARIGQSQTTRTVWVAPAGDAGAEGVDRAQPTTLQSAIDKACELKAPTKIILTDGEYRPDPVTVHHNATVTDRSPGSYVVPFGEALLIFEAEHAGKARITGSDPVPFTDEGDGVYSVPWTKKWGVASQVFKGDPGEDGSVLRRELLFLNGKRMTPNHQGPAKNGKPVEPAQLKPGEFTTNEGDDRIYFKPPAGVSMTETTDVQVSVRGTGMGTGNGYNTYMRTRCLFRVEGRSNLVFRGLVFENLANYINIDAALYLFYTGGKNYFDGREAKKGPADKLPHDVLIDNCTFGQNNGTGLAIKGYRDVTIRDSRFIDNGERGIHTGLVHNLLAEDLEITHNGWRFGDWLTGHTACGWKHIEGVSPAIPSRNVVLRRCAFRKNTKGLWQDYGGAELTLDHCIIEDNEFGGFENEMTKADTIVTDSVIRNNGEYNIEAYGCRGFIFKDTWIYGARPNEHLTKSLYNNNFLLHTDDRPDNTGHKAPLVTGIVIDSCTIVATTDAGNNWWLVDWRSKDNRSPSLQAALVNTIASDFNTWFVRGKAYYGEKHFFSPAGSDYHPDLTFKQWQQLSPASGFVLDQHSKWEDPGDDALASVPDPTVKPRGNQAPAAIPDTASTAPGIPVTIDVLANDFDADGGELTLQSISHPPDRGQAEIEDGRMIYTPDEDQAGGVVLRYTVADPHGRTDTAMVMIAVEKLATP
jgi:hypothetical protein